MSGSDLSLSLHINYVLLATQTRVSQREVSGHQPGVHSQLPMGICFPLPQWAISHGHGSRASSLGPWWFPFTTEHPLPLWSTWVASMEVWELLRVLTADEFLGLPSLPSNVISGWFFFSPHFAYRILGGWIGSSAKNGVNCRWFLSFPGVVSILVASTETPRHLYGDWLSIISDSWYPGVCP